MNSTHLASPILFAPATAGGDSGLARGLEPDRLIRTVPARFAASEPILHMTHGGIGGSRTRRRSLPTNCPGWECVRCKDLARLRVMRSDLISFCRPSAIGVWGQRWRATVARPMGGLRGHGLTGSAASGYAPHAHSSRLRRTQRKGRFARWSRECLAHGAATTGG